MIDHGFGDVWGFPRTCGGDPGAAEIDDIGATFSPHLRG